MLREKVETKYDTGTHTERHFDDIRYAFDAHESERNNGDDRNCSPAKVLHQSEWQGKQIKSNALLEMNTICSAGQ